MIYMETTPEERSSQDEGSQDEDGGDDEEAAIAAADSLDFLAVISARSHESRLQYHLAAGRHGEQDNRWTLRDTLFVAKGATDSRLLDDVALRGPRRGATAQQAGIFQHTGWRRATFDAGSCSAVVRAVVQQPCIVLAVMLGFMGCVVLAWLYDVVRTQIGNAAELFAQPFP
ncbi:hypothetical protein LX36DRAFT_753435 [Colletotrichum falcatum]|nr:hypothetical protein LX36DRAFT_753435 [Colletotrichum falcatum]